MRTARVLSRVGASDAVRKAQIEKLKSGTPEKIEAQLRERFGPRVLQPCDDRDRPFAPGQLDGASRAQPMGASGQPHARPRHPDALHAAGNRASGAKLQDALAQLVGYRPIGIAYPNGDHSPAAVEAALAAGLRLGFTVVPQRSRLAGDNSRSRMTLGRYLLWGGQDIRRQCRKFGARFVPSHMLKALVHPGY